MDTIKKVKITKPTDWGKVFANQILIDLKRSHLQNI